MEVSQSCGVRLRIFITGFTPNLLCDLGEIVILLNLAFLICNKGLLRTVYPRQ